MESALTRVQARQKALTFCRSEFARLFEYIIRLRCDNPPKGTRAQALGYLEQQINAFAKKCDVRDADGTPTGFDDPQDPFAAGQHVLMLREGHAELTRPDAPYPMPLPEGCHLLPQANFNPFAHGRLYNGMVKAVVK